MNSQKTLIFYESRHFNVLRELENKSKKFNLELILFSNTSYKKRKNTRVHITNFNNVRFKDIEHLSRDNNTKLEINNYIKRISNNFHSIEDIIDNELVQNPMDM